ncbi:glutathione-disulfide reductase [Leptolyngbya sp. NIES-2104]|uniref:glutathione-disulfide reductase n=1 Tax=Leptolyngbya sp. NIES-2104 TaxID=1552121 RepID=UPI0006EC7231|nr:glutathione-disulfide reductase [Leptolyngbya sp. NIES-2104]GAP95070.1 glutathione reductase [Leptolyngbya sp. NIES-2104]
MNYDLFVIGAGPGGLSAAKRAAQYGAKVAIAERSHLGGTCTNLGCIPKKLMVYAADFGLLADAAQDYGWTKPDLKFSWQRFKQIRDRELDRLRKVHHAALEKQGITIIQGTAVLVDEHTIAVNDQKFAADKILIAVGGKPSQPKITGIEHTITSEQMFHLEQLPNRLAIIGGGYIGIEFASVMRGLGVDVTLMNHGEMILEGFDEMISTTVRQGLVDRGIQIYCNTTADKIERVNNEIQLHLTGDHSDSLTVDTVLCAIGRAPNLENLGLETVGVEFDKKAIAVDEFSRTNIPNIYAIGDCTNRKQLTPVARAEGKAFAETAFNHQPTQIDSLIPSAVCARPEAASVGMAESEAREQFGDRIQCYQTEFIPLFETLTERKLKSVAKYVTLDDRVIGLHLVGEDSAEMIQGFSLAIKKGITKSEIDHAIAIHPSSAEELFSVD